MFHQWHIQVSLVIFFALLLVTMPAYAVEIFKVSEFGGGHQIWFEVENYDERNPDENQYYDVVDKDDAFGKAINRTGTGGGMIRWTFDIGAAGGKGGTWYFWARIINPNNTSDYLLVAGDPGDDKIPDGPPFPAGDAVPPFDNAGDRIFEENQGPPWVWGRPSHGEGHTKELQNGENTMYIFHRQGDRNIFWDVFMWADDSSYQANDDDYINATEMTAGEEAVNPTGKLAAVWGKLKSSR